MVKLRLLEELTIQCTHFTDKEFALRWQWTRKKREWWSSNSGKCVPHHMHLSEVSMARNWAFLYSITSRSELLDLGSFLWQLVHAAGKYSKIFITIFLFLNFSLPLGPFKHRLCISMSQGDIRLSMKNFLNYIFQSLSSLRRIEFNGKKESTKAWKKTIWTGDLCS